MRQSLSAIVSLARDQAFRFAARAEIRAEPLHLNLHPCISTFLVGRPHRGRLQSDGRCAVAGPAGPGPGEVAVNSETRRIRTWAKNRDGQPMPVPDMLLPHQPGNESGREMSAIDVVR